MNNNQVPEGQSSKRRCSHWSTLIGNDLWDCRWQLLGAYTLSLMAAGAIVLLPWPLKLIIDYVLVGNPLPESLDWMQQILAGFGKFDVESSAKNLTLLFAGAYAFIALSAALLSAADRLIGVRIREKLVLRCRIRVLQRLHGLTLPMLSNYRKGDLVFRISGDVYQFVRLLTKTIPIIFRHTALSVFTLSIMFWIEPRLALVGIVIVGLMTGIVLYFGARLHTASRDKRSNEGDVAGLSQEIVKAIPTVQVLGLEGYTEKRFYNVNKKSLAAGVKQVQVAVNMERAMQIINGIAVALIMGNCAQFVINGQLTLGDMTVFIAYIVQLLKPVEKINELALAVSRGISRGERLASLFAEIPEVDSYSESVPDIQCTGFIEFRSVMFAYSGHRPNSILLNDINFSLSKGQLVLFTGPSGSGKSTLISLLLRQLDPLSGQILLDGRPTSQYSMRSWRNQFGVMLQQHDLFAGTIRDLLWIKELPADDALIWQVLTLVDLDGYVRQLPHGLDADLAEDGINLSGGQRARFSLARTLLLDRPILVLDEPLANIDAKSQSIILNALEKIRSSKTCLVISHQSAISKRADKVYVLESGQLIPTDRSIHSATM